MGSMLVDCDGSFTSERERLRLMAGELVERFDDNQLLVVMNQTAARSLWSLTVHSHCAIFR